MEILDTIAENELLYAIYDVESKNIRRPIFEDLGEAQKALEVAVIEDYIDELRSISFRLERISNKLGVIRMNEQEQKKKEAESKKPPAKKATTTKKPAKKEESETESSSIPDESPSNFYNSEDEDEELDSLTKSELEALQTLTLELKSNKHDILTKVRANLKVVSFTVL